MSQLLHPNSFFTQLILVILFSWIVYRKIKQRELQSFGFFCGTFVLAGVIVNITSQLLKLSEATSIWFSWITFIIYLLAMFYIFVSKKFATRTMKN
jgi:hypothetical protein